MSKLGKVCALALLALLPMSARAIEPGDKVPDLDSVAWLRNGPMYFTFPEEMKGRAFYLVEFWATWSAPSREHLRYLNYLVRKNDGRLKVAAITKEKEEAVRLFLEGFGETFFHVGVDKDGKVSKSYLGFGSVIPTVHVVDRNRRLVWAGEVQDLDDVLDRLFSGKFDVDDQRKISALRKEMETGMQNMSREMVDEKVRKILSLDPRNSFAIRARLFVSEQSGRLDDGVEFLNKLIEKDPGYARLHFSKLDLLIKSGADKAGIEKVCSEILNRFSKDADTLNELASQILDMAPFWKAPLDVAAGAAEQAVALSAKPGAPREKQGVFNETLARVFHRAGLLEKAVARQAKACELLQGTPLEARAAAALDFYKGVQELGGKLRDKKN